PALTVSWRLVHFHLFNEEWASARSPSLNNPVETVSPPLFPACCAWTPTKYNTRLPGGSRKRPHGGPERRWFLRSGLRSPQGNCNVVGIEEGARRRAADVCREFERRQPGGRGDKRADDLLPGGAEDDGR